MPRRTKQKPPRALHRLRVLGIEVAIYAALVTLYLVVVLRALRPLLLATAERHRVVYAALALLLMLGQGVLLEFLTTLLVGRFVRARREDELEAAGE